MKDIIYFLTRDCNGELIMWSHNPDEVLSVQLLFLTELRVKCTLSSYVKDI